MLFSQIIILTSTKYHSLCWGTRSIRNDWYFRAANVIAHYLLFDLFKDKKSDGFDTLFKVEFTKDAEMSMKDDGIIPF